MFSAHLCAPVHSSAAVSSTSARLSKRDIERLTKARLRRALAPDSGALRIAIDCDTEFDHLMSVKVHAASLCANVSRASVFASNKCAAPVTSFRSAVSSRNNWAACTERTGALPIRRKCTCALCAATPACVTSAAKRTLALTHISCAIVDYIHLLVFQTLSSVFYAPSFAVDCERAISRAAVPSAPSGVPLPRLSERSTES